MESEDKTREGALDLRCKAHRLLLRRKDRGKERIEGRKGWGREIDIGLGVEFMWVGICVWIWEVATYGHCRSVQVGIIDGLLPVWKYFFKLLLASAIGCFMNSFLLLSHTVNCVPARVADSLRHLSQDSKFVLHTAVSLIGGFSLT